jgi:hypothetical protein
MKNAAHRWEKSINPKMWGVTKNGKNNPTRMCGDIQVVIYRTRHGDYGCWMAKKRKDMNCPPAYFQSVGAAKRAAWEYLEANASRQRRSA